MLHKNFHYNTSDHKHYLTHGYRLMPEFLSLAGLDRCRQELDHMLNKKRHPDIPPDQVIAAHQQEPWMWELATQPALLDMVETQCGPNIALWSSHLVCKPPHSGVSVPWHQDAPYWEITGKLPGAIWIAFDDIDAENGGMCILPGWHNKGELARRKTGESLFTDEIEPSVLGVDIESRMVQYTLPAGGMATHDTMIPHTSEPNRSDRWRRVLVLRYVSADGQVGPKTYRDYRTGEPFEREMFLVRGSDPTCRNLATTPFS